MPERALLNAKYPIFNQIILNMREFWPKTYIFLIGDLSMGWIEWELGDVGI